MRSASLSWIILFALFLQSCGTMIPAATTETPLPASPAAPTPVPASSSPFIPYGTNIRFEQISLEEGLSQSVVNAILQDRKGFLWVGTDDGLNRYDGYTFTLHKPDISNPESLSDRSITSLVEDSQGFLWIGTRQGGLNRYDPVSGNFTHYLYCETNTQTVSSNLIYMSLSRRQWFVDRHRQRSRLS